MSNKTITFNPLSPSKPFDTISEQILQSPDRATTIEVNRTTNWGKIAFNISGAGMDTVLWDSSSLTFNSANSDLPMVFKGTTNDNLLYIDAANDSIGLGSDETTFPFQQYGGSTFTTNPRLVISNGADGNDTTFVTIYEGDTASKAGLIEFFRSRANRTLPLQFDTVGGFRPAVWDGAKFIGASGLFFSLDANASSGYAPISMDIRVGNFTSPSTIIIRGTSNGNLGLRTNTPSAPITAEGNQVHNFSQVDADWRLAGISKPFVIYYDAGNYQLNIGGSASGSFMRFDENVGRIYVNRTNADIDFQMYSTSYAKIFNMDAGLNQIGFGTTFGTEWLKANATEIVFNETSIARNFRVETDANQHHFFINGTTNFAGINTSTPNSGLQINDSLALQYIATAASLTPTGETIVGVTSTAAPRTITLATADAVAGRTIVVKDQSGGAATNNITVDTQGAELIDGAATYVMARNYESAAFYCDGTNWFVI